MSNVTFGAVIPYFKGEKYWPNLVKSLEGQTMKLDQVVIVMDSPGEALPKFNISMIAKTIIVVSNRCNYGVAKSRNIGISHITTDYIFFLDQDDYWCFNRVKLFYDKISASNSEIVTSMYQRVNQNGKILRGMGVQSDILSFDPNLRVSSQLLSDYNFISICSICIKSNILELFKYKFKSSDDQVQITNLLKKFRPSMIHEVTCFRRFHDSNQSHSKNHLFGMLIASRYFRKSLLLNESDSYKYLSKINMTLGTESLKFENYIKARRYFARSLVLYRLNYKSYFGYLFSRIPFLFISFIYIKKSLNSISKD